jgi:hypothetical protein
MASHPQDDEEAFRWEGDDTARPAADQRPAEAVLAEGWRAVGKGSEGASDAPLSSTETVPADTPTAGEERPAASLGNTALVSLGLLGGIYLLYTVGWVLGGTRLSGATSFWLEPTAVVPAIWVSVAAPALWFGGTLLLTRASATWVRFAWLVAGVFLLLPWPFVIGV